MLGKLKAGGEGDIVFVQTVFVPSNFITRSSLHILDFNKNLLDGWMNGFFGKCLIINSPEGKKKADSHHLLISLV